MTSLPEQFFAARQAQLDNGFNLMRSFSDQALDRTSRVFALQLGASRAAVEQSSDAVRQLLAARDPRDLLAIGTQSQQHLRTMLDYSRELFSIATAGMSVPMLRSGGADTPPAPATPAAAPVQEAVRLVDAASEAFERTGSDSASAAAAAASAATSGVEAASNAFQRSVEAAVPASAPVSAPASPSATAVEAAAEAFERTGSDTASGDAASAAAAASSAASPAAVQPAPGADFALPTEEALDASVSVVTSDIEPDAAPTAIARAASEALDVPVGLPHPVAASLPVEVAVEIELPKIEPVDATPPPAAASTGPVETRGTKGRRKQN